MGRVSGTVGITAHERILRLAPFFALGPISGPLTAGIVLNARGGRPVLASLYGLALGLWLALAPIEVAQLLPAGLARWL
jgi:hypothetical protein